MTTDCKPDRCSMLDVAQIFRRHSPSRCPAATDSPSDPDTSTETNAVRDGGKPRIEAWERDGRTAMVDVGRDEIVLVSYDILADMLTELGFIKQQAP